MGGDTHEGVLIGRGGSGEQRSGGDSEVECDRVELNVLATHGTQLRRYVDSAYKRGLGCVRREEVDAMR